MYEPKKYKCIMYNVPRMVLPSMANFEVIWEYDDSVLLGWNCVPTFARLMHQSEENTFTKLVQFDEQLYCAWFRNILAGSQDTRSKAYKMAVALAAQ